MTIPYRIVLGKTLTSAEKESFKQEIHAAFHKIDTIYNNWNPSSELSKVNRAPSQVATPISQELLEFLKQIQHLYDISEGRFDPTLGKLKTFWITHLKHHSLPDEETWRRYYEQSGWKQIIIDFTHGTITKKTCQVELDFCGVVKGFAVDNLLTICKHFCPNSYVEWGGEIKTSGHHPSGRPWRIASSSMLEIVEIQDQAIATSGNYYQKWTIDGKTYTHILDPYTGKPLDIQDYPILSATVIHPDCAFADAMATVLMTFPNKTEALAWAKEKNLLVYINDNA
ncbi:apbE family protein [Chlamydia psittaci 10_743_SC13]|nr:apbE family protein [Chlamydia psittaci 10_743_SC13]